MSYEEMWACVDPQLRAAVQASGAGLMTQELHPVLGEQIHSRAGHRTTPPRHTCGAHGVVRMAWCAWAWCAPVRVEVGVGGVAQRQADDRDVARRPGESMRTVWCAVW